MNANEMIELSVKSSLDGSSGPCLFDCPANAAAPLLVGLHTWSFDRFNQVDKMLPLCRERGWAALPAAGIPRTEHRVQPARAGRLAPRAWRGRMCWTPWNMSPPLTRLTAAGSWRWAATAAGHGADDGRLRAQTVARGQRLGADGTDPGGMSSGQRHRINLRQGDHGMLRRRARRQPADDAEYRERSPINHVRHCAGQPCPYTTARHDRSVPYTHTANLALAMEKAGAPRFYFEIFDGGHELRYDTAFRWLEKTLAAPAGRPAGKLTG